MMELIKKYKNILMLIAVVVLLFIVYTALFRGDDSSILDTEEPKGPAAALERELLGLLIELKEVELDNAIFSDPAFVSLEDFSQELTPLPIGRINPFAQFGVGNFPATSQ